MILLDLILRLLLLNASLILCVVSDSDHHGHPQWLVNYPAAFHERSHPGDMIDARNHSTTVRAFRAYAKAIIETVDGFTDGELLDAAEHYFWGQTNGVAMELGALDGSPETRSMTFDFEARFNWSRILVEGDPSYKKDLIKNSPKAFSVNAAICEHDGKVHFHNRPYIGGIIEFMSRTFLKTYHEDVFKAGSPKGDLSSVDWSKFPYVQEVDCIPLHSVFAKAKVRHINFFILDVEGGELEVLKSINWSLVKFDVLCIETDPQNRPTGYSKDVADYLEPRGYINHSGQQGRNIWFIRKDFEPKQRNNVANNPTCFDGMRKAEYRDKRYMDPIGTPDFVPCTELVSTDKTTR